MGRLTFRAANPVTQREAGDTGQPYPFALLDSGGGWFRIRAQHSGQCLMLDWRSGSYGNGTNQDNMVNSVAIAFCAAKGASPSCTNT